MSGRHVIARESILSYSSLFTPLTSIHFIALDCAGCSTEIGWKYVRFLLSFSTVSISPHRTDTQLQQSVSPDSSQKYKEGKCILEKVKSISSLFAIIRKRLTILLDLDRTRYTRSALTQSLISM